MKTTFPSSLGLSLLLCLCAFLSACTPQGASQIVGKWQAKDGSSYTEFLSNGKVVLGEGTDKTTGKYKVVSGDRIKMELDGEMGKLIGAIEFKYKLDGDTLVITDPDGEKETLERVK